MFSNFCDPISIFSFPSLNLSVFDLNLIGMSEVNYSLPEWCVLLAKSHNGDTLAGRTVLVHPLSFTVVEVFPFEILGEINLIGPSLGVEYSDDKGQTLKILFVILFTLSNEIDSTFDKVANWYGEYLEWIDKNRTLEEQMKQN